MLIKYFADVRALTGRLEQEWDQPAPTLRDLLLGLAEQYGVLFQKRVLPEGRISDTIIVLVNGQHVTHLDGLDTVLTPEDNISLFPMVAGG
jgi:molybdopterin synthase sulfur carrier subunit